MQGLLPLPASPTRGGGATDSRPPSCVGEEQAKDSTVIFDDGRGREQLFEQAAAPGCFLIGRLAGQSTVNPRGHASERVPPGQRAVFGTRKSLFSLSVQPTE